MGNLGVLGPGICRDGATRLHYDFPDCGTHSIEGVNFLATVDTLFPMVPDPADFGRIVVNHVMGDVYASFGKPKFALAHLGIPHGLEASNPFIAHMMNGAMQELSNIGVPLIGGHTLAKQSDLSLGFSVVGSPMEKQGTAFRAVQPGDPIFLTKRLGSSVASLMWKQGLAKDDDFGDILEGLMQRSDLHAESLNEVGVQHSTDVTGFGLVNHLHRLLLRIGSAAEISVEELPIYRSLEKAIDSEELPTTSLYFDNAHFASRFSNAQSMSAHRRAPFLFDAQVAGGLVFTIPVDRERSVLNELTRRGLAFYNIGRCCEGGVGEVNLK